MNAPRPTMVWVYRYSGLGCAFAAGVMVFMAGGWLVDRVIGSFPVFMVLGALGGAALSTLSIYRRLETSRGPGEEPSGRDRP